MREFIRFLNIPRPHEVLQFLAAIVGIPGGRETSWNGKTGEFRVKDTIGEFVVYDRTFHYPPEK